MKHRVIMKLYCFLGIYYFLWMDGMEKTLNDVKVRFIKPETCFDTLQITAQFKRQTCTILPVYIFCNSLNFKIKDQFLVY